MATNISSQITIKASPEKIWDILTNFEAYPRWNPFVKSISGIVAKGQFLYVHIQPPQAQGMTFRPKVLVAEPNQELRWLGKLWVKGLFDGEHFFKIINNGNGTCTFVQGEIFGGILVPLFRNMLNTNTPRGFEAMNNALKQLAEK